MGGQHLTVGVDVDAPARGLVQQQLQIVQVVAADHDEGALLNRQRHRDRHGVTVCAGVGCVQQRHTGQIDFSGFQHQRQQLVRRFLCADGLECLIEKGVHSGVCSPLCAGVVRIGRHAFEPKEDQRFQRAHVLPRRPKRGKVVIIKLPGADGSLFLFDFRLALQDSFVVEVHVRDRREQALQNQFIGVRCRCPSPRRPRQPDKCPDQLILIVGGVGLFAADTGLAVAAGVMRRLLALKAEHFSHLVSSCQQNHHLLFCPPGGFFIPFSRLRCRALLLHLAQRFLPEGLPQRLHIGREL